MMKEILNYNDANVINKYKDDLKLKIEELKTDFSSFEFYFRMLEDSIDNYKIEKNVTSVPVLNGDQKSGVVVPKSTLDEYSLNNNRKLTIKNSILDGSLPSIHKKGGKRNKTRKYRRKHRK